MSNNDFLGIRGGSWDHNGNLHDESGVARSEDHPDKSNQHYHCRDGTWKLGSRHDNTKSKVSLFYKTQPEFVTLKKNKKRKQEKKMSDKIKKKSSKKNKVLNAAHFKLISIQAKERKEREEVNSFKPKWKAILKKFNEDAENIADTGQECLIIKYADYNVTTQLEKRLFVDGFENLGFEVTRHTGENKSCSIDWV